MTDIICTLRSVVRFRRFERNSALRRLQRCANIDDSRIVAKRRLPGGVFEPGVDHVLGQVRDEVERTMALIGCRDSFPDHIRVGVNTRSSRE